MDVRRFLPTKIAATLKFFHPRTQRLIAAACVVTVLAICFGLRWRAENRRPIAMLAAQYPHSYSRSLSLVLGRGNERLVLADDATSQPIKDFLDAKRPALSQAEIDVYLKSPTEGRRTDIGNYRQVDLMRAGDIYVTAMIWKLFGVSWLAFLRFYVVVSTFACFAIFAATRRISGSFIAGIAAALLYAVSGYESTRVVRDTNPIYFIAFATYGLTLLAGRLSTSACVGRGFALGLLAALGIGWRPQLMFFAPFFLFAAVVRRRFDGDGLRRLIAMTCAFGLGAFATHWSFQSAADPNKEAMIGMGFHIAYFGEQGRAAAAGAENDLQICYDDSKVASDVYLHRAAHQLGDSLPYDAAYAETIRELYFAALQHHVSYWIRGLPVSAASAVSGILVGGSITAWGVVAFLLFTLGLGSLALRSVDRSAVLLMLAIMGFYFGIWFGISPEARHWGVFLVPVCIISGLSTVVISSFREALRTQAVLLQLRKPRNWSLPAAIAGGLTIWLIGCAVADRISSAARCDTWQAIVTAHTAGKDAPPTAWSETVFQIDVPEGTQSFQRGYWVEISAGAQPGELHCKHLRHTSNPMEAHADWEGNPPGSATLDRVREVLWWNTFTETRHRLQPNRNQVFFVTCGRAASCGDTRGYSLKVELPPDSRIVGLRECDLSAWRRPQISSVFQFDATGTTPYVGGQSSLTTQQFRITPEKLAEFGFSNVAAVAEHSTVGTERR